MKLFSKKDKDERKQQKGRSEQKEGDILNINTGSPQYPDNPMNASPGKPFRFRVVDTGGQDINEAWITARWAQFTQDGMIFGADAFDQEIVEAAARETKSLHEQMHGECGHAAIVREIRRKKAPYYDELCASESKRLKDLQAVMARIENHPQ